MGWSHTIVPACLQLGRSPEFIREVVNISIAIHALPMRIMTLLSVDEILLPKYMNWSSNFKRLPFHEEMAAFISKQLNFVWFEFTEWPISVVSDYQLFTISKIMNKSKAVLRSFWWVNIKTKTTLRVLELPSILQFWLSVPFLIIHSTPSITGIVTAATGAKNHRYESRIDEDVYLYLRTCSA